MRVISGTFKGRKLASFRGQCIRPTSDRVREAIFNILTINWEGKEVLDLFAGTGGLGIEALSRGARRVFFIENDPRAILVLEKNIKALNLTSQCELVKLSVEEGIRVVGKRGWKFDIAFLDPPYSKGLAESTLHLIAESDMLKEDGMVIVEHHYKETLLDRYQGLQMGDRRKYGSTGVSFFLAALPEAVVPDV